LDDINDGSPFENANKESRRDASKLEAGFEESIWESFIGVWSDKSKNDLVNERKEW
jgi:hypothetical protein